MNEVFVLDKEFIFNNRVYEITSISIEHNYNLDGDECIGEFLVSGDYRLHEVSVNKEAFNFKIPFTLEIRSNVNLDSVEVEITDFTYDLEDDTLNVHVEYQVNGEQALIEFEKEADLDDFLQNNDAEVVDLSEERIEEEVEELVEEEIQEEVIEEPIIEEIVEEPERIEEETIEEVVETEEIIKEIVEEEEKRIDLETDSIINAINSEEDYVTYHVHTVTASDSFETISASYNINITELKRINGIEELTLNTKLIIPDETD